MRQDNHMLKHLSTNTNPAIDVVACVICGAALALIFYFFLI